MKFSTPLLTLFTVTFVWICSATTLCAQEKLYRYFELDIKSLTTEQSQDIASHVANQRVMELHASCPDKQKMVIKVDASYPKRVPEIEEELKALAGKSVKSKNILSVRSVPVTERNEICQ